MGEKIELSDGTKISKFDAIIKGMTNDAVKGDLKSKKVLLELMHRLESKTLEEEFLAKLIKSGYATEEDVKDYVKYGTKLDLNLPHSVINQMYIKPIIERYVASNTLKWISYINDLYDYVSDSFLMLQTMQKVYVEFDFWNGVDATFDALTISASEKAKAIIEIEKTRNHPRPSVDLYVHALLLYHKSLKNIRSLVEGLNAMALETPFYRQELVETLSKENMDKVLEEIKKTGTVEEYEECKLQFKKLSSPRSSSLCLDDFLDLCEKSLADFTPEQMMGVGDWLHDTLKPSTKFLSDSGKGQGNTKKKQRKAKTAGSPDLTEK